MQKELTGRENDFLILLEEEYGYKHWFWYPEMEPRILIQWWKALKTVEPYFMTPEPLPGSVVFAEDMDHWYSLEMTGQYYEAHIHCDDDSWIKIPNQGYIYHAGYIGEK
ncbi:hypothetical protein [Pseudoalteromonas sp. PPB1]|uniref:hypothetical protein n=1 Tax=Pseudoalteromonas sp. PPB1 TaxID=2756136 RepID=UPI0018912151|nr:hypothetical protein [Pseudoalteromonas sp. PPB1]